VVSAKEVIALFESLGDAASVLADADPKLEGVALRDRDLNKARPAPNGRPCTSGFVSGR
jgi:hypothetical protein